MTNDVIPDLWFFYLSSVLLLVASLLTHLPLCPVWQTVLLTPATSSTSPTFAQAGDHWVLLGLLSPSPMAYTPLPYLPPRRLVRGWGGRGSGDDVRM